MNRWFEITERGSTPGREVRGAVATFLTMSYILFANPSILAAAGVPFQAAASGTALAAGLCSILMGWFANFPIALASGMGLNAVIAYQVAPALGSWQAAMVLVVLDGLIVLVLVLVGLREAIMHAIPRDLRRAIGVGIGLFIAFIGAVNARIIVVPAGTIQALTRDRTAILPPVTHGVLHSAEPLIALTGLLVIAVLMVKRVTGAILIGIVASTLLALLMGVTEPPSAVLAWPRFDTILSPDSWFVPGLAALPVLLSLVMVDFFDTIGTVTAIAEEARLGDDRGRPPRLARILTVDAASASIGGLLGVSSVTSYIESAAGVAEGARTGLHSVVVGVLFLLAILIAPLLSIVPSAATAPALIVVGFLMCQQIARIQFHELDTAIPAFILLITIPFTYSISHGIGLGFISYVLIKLLTGQARDVHPLMLGTAAAFAAYFALA